MEINKIFYCFILFMFFLPLSSGAPFIVGRVNDALDGTSANGRTIVLWNPAVGITDNVTDTIGPSGNSGSNNNYSLDCGLLSNGCTIGTIIHVKVLGNRYVTNYTNITINGAGFQQANNLTLNSPPIVNLSSPINHANFSSSTVNLYCNVTDYDGNLNNVTLYGNWSNGWHPNQTFTSTGYSYNASFSKNIPDGKYIWSCMATDDLFVSSFTDMNYTLTIDSTPPNIHNITLNLSSPVCGLQSNVQVNCNIDDLVSGVSNVFVRVFNQSGHTDYNTTVSGNNYHVDIALNTAGEWQFGCYANDTFGNNANLNSTNLSVSLNSPDLFLTDQYIIFNPTNPIESQITTINATILNNGCSDANNFLVGFYVGDPSSGGAQIGDNQTLSVQVSSNSSAYVEWPALIGTSNIFVKADIENVISEIKENNNVANSSKFVTAWQTFYGNATLDKVLANSSLFNISLWYNQSRLSGNIFISDVESIISWSYLLPIGKNVSLSNTSDDFTNVDYLFNMTGFNDSISSLYTTNGATPRTLSDFVIYQRNLTHVAVLTTSQSFATGILWDSFDDSNGEYDTTEKEDLVFVSKVNNSEEGLYGTYDYEISIPARLREYDANNAEDVYIYFDLN